MGIDFNGNLKWVNNGGFGFFTWASVSHCLTGIILTALVMNGYYYFNIYKFFTPKCELEIKGIILILVISNLIHAIEDMLENSTINGTSYSLEGLISKAYKCRDVAYLDTQDHDSLNNFLGDLLSFGVGSILIIFILYKYDFDFVQLI